MIELTDFSEWMRENTILAESSIYKYTRAIPTISREMKEKGVITQSLLAMSILQLDVFIPLILQDSDFVKKDKRGNHMYSNALKQFRMFRKVETTENVEASDVVNAIEGYRDLQETERNAIVKARVGQGSFRKDLLKKYDNKCIITGIQEKKLLIASHIKPWAVCNNSDRLSVENGLLLSPTFDKLFDCGLISFTNEGKILISTFLSAANVNKLHISTTDIFDIKASSELKHNLEYHRDVIFTTRKKKNNTK
ncbi:MAG: HNH endonuclease [Lachnospiraceae bacterium]|nr:HNH endonuclease [Lachnospiraceae bacterium]